MSGDFDSALVQIDATLLGRSYQGQETVLTLGSRGITFTASLESPLQISLQEGSLVRVTGVCLAEADEARVARAFRVLLRAPRDVVVVARPPWWTLKSLALVISLMAVAIIGTMVWVRALRRTVERQTALIRKTLHCTADGILVADEPGRDYHLQREVPIDVAHPRGYHGDAGQRDRFGFRRATPQTTTCRISHENSRDLR